MEFRLAIKSKPVALALHRVIDGNENMLFWAAFGLLTTAEIEIPAVVIAL